LLLLVAVLLLLLVLLLRGLGEVAPGGRAEREDGAGHGGDDPDFRVAHNWTIRATATIRHATCGSGVADAELIDVVVGRYGGVDVLVNNVGASEPAASINDFTDEQWQRIFDVTLFSAVRAVRSAVPAMRGRKGAAIVTIGSLNTRLPAGMIAPYCAAKAALGNFTKAVAEELAPAVRVNTVSPGPVRTPMWTDPGAFADVFADQASTTRDDVMDRLLPEMMSISSGRISEPEEIADLVAFLASPRAANITGADHIIDGGLNKTA
jgi:NAD(P)-dependent dehydrogenase (short-subunit alcohol dehydrogenase family)